MQSPFFSVILPTYNRANMIGRAIESVIAQTYTNWELLVVDDGSTDNTKQVVEAYNDSRIRYIYQQNAERSAARNNGIDNAKGEYVCFIDSDDYYFDNHLSSFYNYIQENNIKDALLFSHTSVDINGKVEEVPYNPQPAKNNIEFFILNTVGIPRTCISLHILKENKFNPAVSIGEDTELWVRIGRHYPIYCIEKYTQAYTEHDNRSVSFMSVKPFLANLENFREIFSQFSKDEISVSVRAYTIAYSYFRIAQYYQFKNAYFKMCKALFNSSLSSPGYRFKEKIYMLLIKPFKK